MTLPTYFSYSGADIPTIRKRAEELFANAQFNCSEAVMYALREAFFPSLPDYVIAAVSGYPVGIGGSGCSCGAVTGAICALGLLFGREKSPELLKATECMKFAKEVHDDFFAKHNAICCRYLTRGMDIRSMYHSLQCREFTGDAAEAAARIILREFDKSKDTKEENNKSTTSLSADSKVTDILEIMPEAATVFQGYGMTCLAHVIANDETLRVAVTHKNLPLDKICKDLKIPYT